MKILSLFWHSVESDSIDPEYLDGSNPTASMFRDQIKYIVNKYTPISIVDFMKITEKRNLVYSFEKPPVLLGFDDGFKNVIDQALPVLNEFKIPAVFFVIGEILKNPNFVPWYVEMKHLIRKTKKKTVINDNVKTDLVSKKGRTFLMRHSTASFLSLRSESDRQRFLTNFASLLGIERTMVFELDDDLRFIDKENLSNLSSTSLLTVASHAMTHRYLTSLTYEEQVYELEQSDFLLKEHCPSYYPTVSYPLGFFNTDTIEIAKRIYKSAFAVYTGSSYRNLYAYPRIGIGHCSVQELTYTINPIRINYLLPVKRFLHNTGIRKI